MELKHPKQRDILKKREAFNRTTMELKHILAIVNGNAKPVF